ncbi:response regulator transcription factor [Nonomuraea turkmeniaca]|uniref:Response regulator transcription factor n=1 Tax=Nonomuraea turkmeniaca TaxID=103838 RepID=A0A5S4EVU5_9ACTN|nr:response regulator transcription factor [Nonomuraea turkmeniaca]TMR07676.1 response regulator transcription factor [Nonomuraea turkmeniaca]
MTTPAGGPIRLLIVDDDAMVRAGLSMILGGTDDIEIVAEAGDGSEVPPLVAEHRPDVVLMDIRMPGVDGLTATEALRAQSMRGSSPPEVVVLTTFHADAHVLRALRAGAAGFLLKDIAPGDLVQAIRKVAAGEPILSPAVTRQLITHVSDGGAGERTDRARKLLARLSEREHEVALAVGRGRSNAEIARELYMSVPTVKAHVSRILTKLDLNNRVQVALLVYDANG